MHELTLLPNHTLWIQLALFLGCYLVLRSLVFHPFLALVAERERRTSGLMKEAAKKEAHAHEVELEYRQFIEQCRSKGRAHSEEKRRQNAVVQKALVQKARVIATQEIRTRWEALRSEQVKAAAQVQKRIPDLAVALVKKFLPSADSSLISEELIKNFADQSWPPQKSSERGTS